ncbi:MAG: hypothetical protein KF799_02435 [Bdellovibrionales bacterium]|nr:hypothetical protein [Bdellovibrionales bacterium]
MDGTGLLRTIIEATGLPGDSLEKEMDRVIRAKGLDPANITLDDIREVLATYLQDALCEAKDSAG